MSATFKLHNMDGKPSRNLATGKMVAIFSPRVRLLTPYVLVADRAARHYAWIGNGNDVVRPGDVEYRETQRLLRIALAAVRAAR